MRLRNFGVQMSFALFIAFIIVVITHDASIAILYVLFHLGGAFFSDCKTVYGEKELQEIG